MANEPMIEEPLFKEDDLSKILVSQLCARLPEKERALFWMRYIEGYTSTELGEMFNLPSSTIRSRLSSARKKCLKYILCRKEKVIDVEKKKLVINAAVCDARSVSETTLESYEDININAATVLVSYPSDIKDKLPLIKVNGSTDSYPGDAIRLKSKLIIDKTFILRAKGEKYYVRNKVIIPDKDLNIASLKEIGATFITKKAIIAESLLEKALPLFDEHAEIKTIPDGLIYTNSQILNDVLIRKYGDKLYVDGDLTINLESENALDKLTRLKVEGTVFINEKFIDRFHNINPEYNDMEATKGASIGDKAFLTIDKRKLNKYTEGVRVFDCGIVNIKDDIDPDEIEEKLEFVDCGVKD